jgi:hypothetical protein
MLILLTTKITKDTKGGVIKTPNRALRITMVQSLRSLRKFLSHCSYVAVLNEKIRPHHEVHEGHEGFRIFQTELRDFRVLRGEHLLVYLVAVQPR